MTQTRATSPPAVPGSSPAPASPAGGTLLLSDVRIAAALLNELRYRTMRQVFGLSREQANLATAVALLTVGQATGERVVRFMRAPGVPSLLDVIDSSAALSAVLGDLAGPPASEVPGAGMLLALALGTGAFLPAAVRGLHAARTRAHGLNVGFHHRYGYLVDPGHWRSARARRRGAPLPGDPAAIRPAGDGSGASAPAATASR